MTEPKEDRSFNLRRKTVVTVISKIGDRRPQADACLVCIHGHEMGRLFRMKRGEVMIGRSSQATIQIDHESVSRRHALLKLGDTGATILDCGSTNGTYVNDEPVQERTIHDGDFIKIGRTILKYLANDNVEASYHEEIYRLTTIDGLTRCFNRRYLREQLVREASRAIRYGRPLSLMLFDIDGFQRVNDDYGHLAGDAILSQLGRALLRRVRREDVVARLAGGQFAVIAPELSLAKAKALADRIRELIAASAFGFDDIQIPVSISLGLVNLSEINEDELSDDLMAEVRTSPGFASLEPLSRDSLISEGDVEELDRFGVLADGLFHVARERLVSAKKRGPGTLESGDR